MDLRGARVKSNSKHLQEKVLIPDRIHAFEWDGLGFDVLQFQHQERVVLLVAATVTTTTTLLLLLLLMVTTGSRYFTAFDCD